MILGAKQGDFVVEVSTGATCGRDEETKKEKKKETNWQTSY